MVVFCLASWVFSGKSESHGGACKSHEKQMHLSFPRIFLPRARGGFQAHHRFCHFEIQGISAVSLAALLLPFIFNALQRSVSLIAVYPSTRSPRMMRNALPS